MSLYDGVSACLQNPPHKKVLVITEDKYVHLLLMNIHKEIHWMYSSVCGCILWLVRPVRSGRARLGAVM